jgi:glutamate-1-semialdehyde 2,1-aminomutase
VWDAEGNRLIDYVSSWGAIIVGHADPEVVAAIQEAAREGASYGAPTPGEIALGERIQAALPSMERMRFTSSGTEAVMSAVRLARAHTGRTKVLKFAGCYHGHSDALLTEAGSGVATLGLPGSAGVPPEATRDTLVAPYNDIEGVNQLFDRFPGEIAAVLVEPVAANMGLILPAEGFLAALRERTTEEGALLVFDEVITGFRVGPGGAQARFGVIPDLTCLGKIIGGGLPVGAFGGRADIMGHVAPEGPMYQAGTLSGNPLAMAAGAAALKRLADPVVFDTLEARTQSLAAGLGEGAGEQACVARIGSLLTLFFRNTPPTNYAEAQEGDSKAFAGFFHSMLERGVALPPSSFEAWFLTLAHDEERIEDTLRLANEAFEVNS